jgi:hypothetical protein
MTNKTQFIKINDVRIKLSIIKRYDYVHLPRLEKPHRLVISTTERKNDALTFDFKTKVEVHKYILPLDSFFNIIGE